MDHFVQRSCLLVCGRPRIRVRFCFRIHSPPLFAAIMNEMITRQQSAQLVLRKHLVRALLSGILPGTTVRVEKGLATVPVG
ncbi:hypothetical protein V6N13_060052 [Hibiscus sabdariffa]|uniref:Uncharacterized protein n=1 Tax=Hibiscus sabdariffa TaxID=183260 RepID=A0ABR2GB35_9ROSI